MLGTNFVADMIGKITTRTCMHDVITSVIMVYMYIVYNSIMHFVCCVTVTVVVF